MLKLLVLLPLLFYSNGYSQAKKTEAYDTARQYTQEMLGEAQAQGFRGKVTEVIEVPTYTYVQFHDGQKLSWLATNKIVVKKGDLISFAKSQSMHNFRSKVLNRTFEHIFFVSDLNVTR